MLSYVGSFGTFWACACLARRWFPSWFLVESVSLALGLLFTVGALVASRAPSMAQFPTLFVAASFLPFLSIPFGIAAIIAFIIDIVRLIRRKPRKLPPWMRHVTLDWVAGVVLAGLLVFVLATRVKNGTEAKALNVDAETGLAWSME